MAGLAELDPVLPARRGAELLRRLRRDPAAMISGAIIVMFIASALLAPLLSGLSGNDPYRFNQDALAPGGVPLGVGGGISVRHWFGVEPLTGRDLFSVVVHGGRVSLLVGIAGTAVSVLIGTAIGMLAGFLGGWTDRLLSRTMDVVFGFPFLIFMIALGAILPPTLSKTLLIVVILGFFGWPQIARVVRSQTMVISKRSYVTASVIAGGTGRHVLLRQVLPNLIPTIVVFATLSIPGKIGAEAALSFLGVGVPPPTPAWGRAIGEAVNWISIDPMYLIFPGAALVIVTLAFNIFGDSLTEALDPRMGRYG